MQSNKGKATQPIHSCNNERSNPSLQPFCTVCNEGANITAKIRVKFCNPPILRFAEPARVLQHEYHTYVGHFRIQRTGLKTKASY